MRRLWLHFLLMPAILAAAGCGQSHGIYPVSGKVLFRGDPAAGATISFVPQGANGSTKQQIAQGVVQEDGTFSLASPLGGGIVPGEYAVLVEWKVGAGKERGRSPGLGAPDRLKRKYLDSQRPLLTAKVEAKSNTLSPFELQE